MSLVSATFFYSLHRIYTSSRLGTLRKIHGIYMPYGWVSDCKDGRIWILYCRKRDREGYGLLENKRILLGRGSFFVEGKTRVC